MLEHAGSRTGRPPAALLLFYTWNPPPPRRGQGSLHTEKGEGALKHSLVLRELTLALVTPALISEPRGPAPPRTPPQVAVRVRREAQE